MLKVPPPVAIALIDASPISIKQNVPCATVSILFTVAFENGSQVSHNIAKFFSFGGTVMKYLMRRLIE